MRVASKSNGCDRPSARGQTGVAATECDNARNAGRFQCLYQTGGDSELICSKIKGIVVRWNHGKDSISAKKSIGQEGCVPNVANARFSAFGGKLDKFFSITRDGANLYATLKQPAGKDRANIAGGASNGDKVWHFDPPLFPRCVSPSSKSPFPARSSGPNAKTHLPPEAGARHERTL
jgi:hypothetical protein